ncbi:hypothetical protein F5Y18DRAFT_287253 [Xylariaceae sp. FL1019]|nr:hypothetical protein F5Y18DRAFT_287253 [Xylariaceae sp. FL1019]
MPTVEEPESIKDMSMAPLSPDSPGSPDPHGPQQAQAPLGATTTHQQHHPHPSLSALSETSRASSDVSSHAPFPSFTDYSPSLNSFPTPLSSVSSPRNAKGLALNNRATISAAQPIRRKPLSSTASSIATRYSSGEYLASASRDLPRPDQRYDRSFSLDSPTVYEFPLAQIEPMSRAGPWESTTKPTRASDGVATDHNNETKSPVHKQQSPLASVSVPAVVDAAPAIRPGQGRSPDVRDSNSAQLQTIITSDSSQPDEQTLYDDLLADDDDDDDDDAQSDNILDGYQSDSSDSIHPSPVNHNMSLHISRKPIPQHLNLQSVEPVLVRTNSNELKTPNTDKPLPKSPSSSKLGSFFGWAASPVTESSEKTYSPLPSPYNFPKPPGASDASPITAGRPQSLLDAPKAQFGSPDSREYCESYLATPTAGSIDPAEIDEMEDELKAISAELAASIRREMDLEDLVDRLQAEKENPTTAGNKRTSDYFSDSGYSSAKLSEYEQSREEIERIQRRSEQEKAQLRLELTNKLQDERLRRQQMDEQIRELSAKASQIDLVAVADADAGGRVKELEATCGTLRRKLSDERQIKDNFEDLLSALRGELQDASNERDNLREEIVPQLRARVEGLESQAAELEKMTYESTKMQQELQSLRSENTNLKQNHMGSITEEGDVVQPSLSRSNSRSNSLSGSTSLSRSNSVGGSSFRLQRPPSGLSRSKTIKSSESRDQLSERLKDVEEQRDALHRALKNLLERQEHQNRENQKKIRFLETERERILAASPQKVGFQREVTNLRAEITVLRRRAEEALDQKWQVEKGLAGLKMDLDRAEQEVASLRELLGEKDILIPPALHRSSSGSDEMAFPVTSDSLMIAYQDLQAAYADSIKRIKNLEAGAMSDERTQVALERLEDALSSAVSERDHARNEAVSYQEQLQFLRAGEQTYLQSEKELADELQESARRIEELAIQVQQQLSTNQQLRQRIATIVARGEADQKANVEQITNMQARLRSLEEKLEVAQAATEDRVARHEEEMSVLKESHNAQLTRLRDGLRSPRTFPGKSPLSPLFAAPGARSPRLSETRTGPAMNVSEETQVDNLRARVAELENALMDADSEMQQVVGRMNTAQIEVLELQEEREAAVNKTRKLERELQAERVKAFEDRFRTLQA